MCVCVYVCICICALYYCIIIKCMASGELGDYDPEEHPEGYVSGYRFVPNQVLYVWSVVDVIC